MKPNTSFIRAFTIKNQGETTQITPKIAGIRPIDAYGHTTIDPTPLALANYPLSLSLENADYALNVPFTLRAREEVQLVLRIESASVAEPEDVYLGLVLETGTTIKGPTTTQPSIVALLLTTITEDGQIPISLEIGNFDPPRLHDSGKPLSLEPILKNNASSMVRPLGTWKITNARGHVVLEESLYPNLVLAGAERAIQAQKDTNGQPESIPLTWKPSLFDLGPHQITLTITSSGGTTYVEESRTVWILPIQAIIYIMVLALMITIVITHRQRADSTNPT